MYSVYRRKGRVLKADITVVFLCCMNCPHSPELHCCKWICTEWILIADTLLWDGEVVSCTCGKAVRGVDLQQTPESSTPLTPQHSFRAVLRWHLVHPIQSSWAGQVIGVDAEADQPLMECTPNPNTIVCPVHPSSDWLAQIFPPLWLVAEPAALLVLAGRWARVECSGGRRGNPGDSGVTQAKNQVKNQVKNQPRSIFAPDSWVRTVHLVPWVPGWRVSLE